MADLDAKEAAMEQLLIYSFRRGYKNTSAELKQCCKRTINRVCEIKETEWGRILKHFTPLNEDHKMERLRDKQDGWAERAAKQAFIDKRKNERLKEKDGNDGE